MVASVSVPSNPKIVSGQVREVLEIADRLELVARQDRREPQRLGAVGGGGPIDHPVDPDADRLERAAATEHAGHAARDEQPGVDEGVEEGGLVRRPGPEGRHRQTSLAIRSRLALV